MTSRDDFLNAATDEAQAVLSAFYARIEQEMANRKGKATTFQVGIPDKVTSPMVKEVIAYYQAPPRNWTVTQSQQHTDRYLNFS